MPEPIAAEMVKYEVTQERIETVLSFSLPEPVGVELVLLNSSLTIESVVSPVPLPIQFVHMQSSDSIGVVSF